MVDEFEESVEGPDERRRDDRLRLIVDVFYDGNDSTGVAATTDISAGGFYMNTNANIPAASVLLVRIRFGDGMQVIAHAEVVYAHPGRGVGLRFQSLSEQNRKIIERELGNA